MPPFKEKYHKEVIPALKERLGYVNSLAVPRVTKVVVAMGVGRIFRDDKLAKEAREVLRAVTGQEPAARKARVAIASFKTRVGSPVGLQVTLRRARMADFLDRLIHVALPRTRDFRGLSESAFDEKGNLTVGVKEHIVFPETAELPASHIYGFGVTVITNAHTREEGMALMKALGFPIQS